jgi:hypothetical protein
MQNVAPQGGGVYLLGEKAKLETRGVVGSHIPVVAPVRGSSTQTMCQLSTPFDQSASANPNQRVCCTRTRCALGAVSLF